MDRLLANSSRQHPDAEASAVVADGERQLGDCEGSVLDACDGGGAVVDTQPRTFADAESAACPQLVRSAPSCEASARSSRDLWLRLPIERYVVRVHA